MGVGGGTVPAQHVGRRTRVRRSADRAMGADRRGRADRFGHRVEHADWKALMCVVLAGAGSVAVALVRRIVLGSAGVELMAALVCHILALPLVGIPVAILVFNALLPGVLTRPTCEICAVWLLWNFGWLFYVSLIWPFLLSSLGTQHTYADVLYDYTVFLIFIPIPVVLGSGILKALSVRVGWRWGWRQRAVLGTALGTVALCMWTSQYYVRPDGFAVTVLLSLAFYVYTAATFLPPAFDPCAPAPEVSGSRYWPLMRNALYDGILHLAISYLNLSVTLDAAAEEAVDAGGRGGQESQDKRGPGSLLGEEVLAEGRATMMGFHPHGIIPVSGGLISLTGQWKRLFGDLVPCMMIDFMIHIIPVWRDVVQWMGSREVSKEGAILLTISAALKDSKTCIVVPGGQAEISLVRSWENKVYLLGGRKGFVRMALLHGARLVPVVSMGEWDLLDNVYWPHTQSISRRIFGFPIPFWPVGLCYLPIPRRPQHGITVVIGKPIAFECREARQGGLEGREGTGGKSEGMVAAAERFQEDVETCHSMYFKAVADIFERHKATCGYPDHQLVMLESMSQFPHQPHDQLAHVNQLDSAKTKTR